MKETSNTQGARNLLPSIAIFILLALTLGCSNDLTAVIHENQKAMENENITAVMNTIHEQSPAYAMTKVGVQQIFNLYDLKYDLKKVKVIEKSDSEARVRMVLVTKKVSGPAFRDNKATAVNVLRKHNGTWKIYSTEIEDIDFL